VRVVSWCARVVRRRRNCDNDERASTVGIGQLLFLSGAGKCV